MPHDSHLYSNDFYLYINSGSLSSASVICPLMVKMLRLESLLDVGCGAGAWCKIWKEAGVVEVLGIDGDYVDRNNLLIDSSIFKAFDLSLPVDLGRKFDLVTSLEVAEHVPAHHSDIFLDNLVRHSNFVLFSAAIPGQGGEFHVNEQPLSYWREKFLSLGYRCFDPLRALVKDDARVEPWYRYNILLYVNDQHVELLPENVRSTEIVLGRSIPDFSSVAWRFRNHVLSFLPESLHRTLVSLKHSWVRRHKG